MRWAYEDVKEDSHPIPKWELYVDGASNEYGAGAGIILVSPEGHRIHSVLRFKFNASNNEAEYEALLAGLRIARELKVEHLGIVSDSQLVVNQILGEYQARGLRMEAYLAKAQELLHTLGRYTIRQVPREQNSNADALAKLATSRDSELIDVVPVENLEVPSIDVVEEISQVGELGGWMQPIVDYLTSGTLPPIRIMLGNCCIRHPDTY